MVWVIISVKPVVPITLIHTPKFFHSFFFQTFTFTLTAGPGCKQALDGRAD